MISECRAGHLLRSNSLSTGTFTPRSFFLFFYFFLFVCLFVGVVWFEEGRIGCVALVWFGLVF